MNLQPVTLTGRYVRLEPLSVAHVPDLARVGLEESIWRYLIFGEMRTEANMRAWVQDMLKRQESGMDLPFAVIALDSERAIGATRYLDILPQHRQLEIGGTWYGLAYQRTAVNTESKYLLLKYAFEELDYVRVQLKTDLRNERSQRAIERLGAVKEGVLRKHMVLPDSFVRHSVIYSIIDEEWPVVKVRLEGMLSARR